MREKILLLLLLLLSTSFALDCITNATSWILQEQGTLIILVLVFTALLIAIAYMLGVFMKNVSFIVFAKDEAYHLGFSLLLLAAFGTILMFSCTAIDTFYGVLFEELESETSLGCYKDYLSMNDVSLCYMETVTAKARHTYLLYHPLINACQLALLFLNLSLIDSIPR